MTMNPARTKVILVVNSTFPRWGNEDKSIQNAEQNIEQLQKIFYNNSFFGIPNNHLIPILNETSQEILLKVKAETKSSPDKEQFERLIFYYCGHGIPGEDSKLFFAAKDTVRADYEITSVDSRRLFSYLKSFGAKELIVILDCCYAAQTRENQGDADSLIAKCLPVESAELGEQENGTYYLFAAGKDNVAKFNPREPRRPTYFTAALLTTITTGTQSGSPYIKMGELYKQLRTEINKLQKLENPDIPDPRPGLEGDVNEFLFCKNIRFQNQEDSAWEVVMAKRSSLELQKFLLTYPNSKYSVEANVLILRILNGSKKLKKAISENDYASISEIAIEYSDIPEIKLQADKKMREALAEKVSELESFDVVQQEKAEDPNKTSELVNAGKISEDRPNQNGGTSSWEKTMSNTPKRPANTVLEKVVAV